MNNLVTSPSSSPTSVALDDRSMDKRKQVLALDESEHCASNPQQGTTSHSSQIKLNQTVEARKDHPSVRRASRKEGRQKRPPRLIDTRPNMKIPATHKDNRKLFVGGLPPDVTSEEFYHYFVQYGDILDSVVMFDKATQRCRGFGFITYHDPQVTADLLRLGGAEEATAEGKGSQNGYLEMRGKVIEIKRAQPKSSGGGSPNSMDKSASGSNHSRRGSVSRQVHSPNLTPSADHYNCNSTAMNYPHPNTSYGHYGDIQHSQIQHQQHHHHLSYHHQQPHTINQSSFVPATPVSCYNDTSGASAPPMTPQQAVLDLAHHMLFYSQLLATPSLMAQQHHGMVSPMMSPGMIGVQAYSDYFQPFYDEDKSKIVSPVPPTLRKVPEGESFEIGDCKFFRETPLSPSLDSSKPSLRPSEEKR